MTKNITLRMDDSLLRQLRHKAVDADMSLSAWVVAALEREIGLDAERDSVRREALAQLEVGLNLGGRPLTREEIYDR